MSADSALLLGFGEHVHHTFILLSPICFGEAMHEAYIDIVGAEFAAEAIKIFASSFSVPRPGFCKHRHFIPRHVLERFRDMGVTPIGIGSVKKAQPLIVAVQQESREAIDAE